MMKSKTMINTKFKIILIFLSLTLSILIGLNYRLSDNLSNLLILLSGFTILIHAYLNHSNKKTFYIVMAMIIIIGGLFSVFF